MAIQCRGASRTRSDPARFSLRLGGTMIQFDILLVVLGLCLASQAWAPLSISRTILIGGSPYYIPAESILTLPQVILPGDVLPFSVFATNGSLFTRESLSAQISNWKANDDVFEDEFLQAALLLHRGHGSAAVSPSAASFFTSRGSRMLMLATSVQSTLLVTHLPVVHIGSVTLNSGPYILARDANGHTAVFVAYRLFRDNTQSFFKSVIPQSDGSFTVVSASLDTDSSPYIGVPSKAYALEQDRAALPLAGLRVSVKDIYFLKGLRTSAGNRQFFELYPPRNATGPAITRLLSLGANIVGVTKTVQFANGDRATADWVDYHAPFVVRGDGNREPSGSSTGAGAGISALDFIDVAIGSDTGGSIRGPAGVNGLYGLRPSVGAISLEEVVPLNDVLDTGGYIARDPTLFADFGKAWYGETFQRFNAFPKKILLSDDFQHVQGPALEVYTAFFSKLRQFLGPDATIANFSISAEWNATSDAGVPLTTWLNTTYPTMVAFHQWTVVGQPFFSDYAAANGGRKPHINPSVLARWMYGQAQGESGYATALNQRSTFENWVSNHFLLEDGQSCSESLYLYPQNAGDYSSRETYFTGPQSPPFGFSSGRIAVHARSPDMVVPIGQIAFNSTISGVEEQLPVTVSIVTRRECDFMLLDLLQALAAQGIVKTVKTGRTAF